MTDAAFRDAAAKAVSLLAASRFPVIAGLVTDVAGVVAALRLAEKLGGAVDHMAAGPHLREAAVLHDAGLMLVTPDEACRRADTILIVGDEPMNEWPAVDAAAEIVRLPLLAGGIPAALSALRAVLNGRPVARAVDRTGLDALAARLKAARYGVAVWSPGELDALSIEMLVGLIKDLNVATRWAGASVGGDDQTAGAAVLAGGWVTGLPLRVGFRDGVAGHDPWRFEAERLVKSGEADAVVWVSAFGDPPPPWLAGVSVVAIGDQAALVGLDGVAIVVGRPGLDHDAVLYDRRAAMLVEVAATSPTRLPDAALALELIVESLPG